ncbi:MAG TPA: translocase [Planctomycetaceae bacterium]|nr:translocase [Planctomycetaceae bacterium]
MLADLWTRLPRTASQRLANSRRNLPLIAALEAKYQKLSNEELRKESLDLRWRAKEREHWRRLLPEAFALVREASVRTTGMRHYDSQMLAGGILQEGCIAEMETGEGKTLMATLPAYLNALQGRGVHVITVNDYLASRDAELMGPIFEVLGMKVGCIQALMTPDVRRPQYEADVTYGTANEFAFDFLKDRISGANTGRHMGSILFGTNSQAAVGIQRGHYIAIIDEADSILIDEARTPLIISAPEMEEEPEIVAAYRWASTVPSHLEERRDYKYDREKKTVELTAEGCWRVRNLRMPEEMSGMNVDEIYEYVERAVKVKRDFQLDRQYTVRDGEIMIVDEFTGRIMVGRKWRDGIHQAIEAKEGITITAAANQAARTTIQSYFRRYERLAGMTGTARSAAKEMRRIYRMPVVKIPTHRPCQRKHLPDQVYPNDDLKWTAVADEIARLYGKGQPVLIGTRSIDKSEKLSVMLQQRKIPHTVLNAKHHAKEAAIVAEAGKVGAVTIATNMAGRGVDIKLQDGVPERGGLHVLGTEKHDSARIDRQLQGRSARQGDPGSTQFFLSLEDELLDVLGAQTRLWLKAFKGGTGRRDGLRRVFVKAQQRVERKHYKERVQLMNFEKLRNEMQEKMGLDPFLNAVD